MSARERATDLPRRADVVIVGGGIAGCALAAALADSGMAIVLIEANDIATGLPRLAEGVATVDPRVSALNLASERLLARLGAWQRMPPPARAAYDRMRVWEEDGTSHIEFRADAVGAPALGHIVENRWITGTLLDVLAGCPNVRIHARQRLLRIDRDGDALHVVLDSGATIDAGLLVGADGAQSPVRRLAGIAGHGEPCGQRAIVATIRTAGAHDRIARQVFLQTGPLALLPLADPRLCSIVWSADDAAADELLALDDAGFAARLASASEQCLGAVLEVSPRFAFPLRQHHAATYVAPGIALVADAAHVVHPLAGQGINLGLADVAVLAEEVRRARARGLGPGDALALGRYQRRRRADNALMLRAMRGLQLLYGDRRPAVRFVRNLGLGAVQQSPALKRQFMRHAMGL